MELKCKLCGSAQTERRGIVTYNDVAKQRLFCKLCGKWSRIEITYKKEPSFERTPEQIAVLTRPATERYIITSAQNDTPLHKKFYKAIHKWAAYFNAQVLVIPVLYRNPTNPGELEKQEANWPKEVEPFLIGNETHLPYGLRVMGNVRIQATAVNPLVGFESLTQGDSAIFGHGQIQQRTIATPQNRLPKILTTTGSTSIKNYSKTKAGIKGAFHHSLGAAIVEIDNEEKITHLRLVVGDETGEFYDLNYHVTHRRVKKIKSIPAIVTGDEQHKFMDEEVAAATYIDDDSMVHELRPKFIVRSDIIDSYSISHHHRNKPSIRLSKSMSGDDSLENELRISSWFLENTTPPFSTNVIVPSNHHNHITQWLEETDWRQDPVNAKIYHQMWAAWILAIEENRDFHPFTWWMKQNCKADTLYLMDDYPFIVEGIYLGYHGDRGPNGAKGNIRNMSKIGVKVVIGHFHTPGIEKGAYQVGTCTKLKLEYTSGPSSWHNTHCLVHPNGKRQLVNIIRGYWRK